MNEFERINGLAAKATATEQHGHTENIRAANERLTEFQRALTMVTTEFIRTGIGRPGTGLKGERIYTWWLRWGYRSHFDWRAYFRQLARDTHRPFVYLRDDYYLEIERKKYTEPLVAGFLLIAEKHDSAYLPYTPDRIVYYPQQTLWNFRFNGDAAKEQVEDWTKQCATDRRMRKALRLDT